LGLDISWRPTGGVCDGNNIGPRGGAIHSDEEFLIVDSLAERAQLSALTLMRLAARGGL
jgi:glutamate carboxypeptidase